MKGENTCVTVGFFDGVHRGHQALIGQLCELALQRGQVPVVVTFDQSPRQVVCPGYRPQLLSTTDEKLALLRQTGVERIEVLAFDRQLASLSARDFMEQVLGRQLHAATLLTGYDNRFGHRDAIHPNEGFADYVGYGRELGIDVVAGQPLPLADGVNASSSLARRALSEGDVDLAARCLGRPYSLAGTVVSGQHIGRRLGFPTANLRPETELKVIPAPGVYAVRAAVGGQAWPAMMNIGTRPTFDGQGLTLEVHLLGFQGDIYGRPVRVDFVSRLRSEQRFESAEALQRQLAEDSAAAQRIVGD